MKIGANSEADMTQIDVPLSQLISLDDAGVSGAKEAYGTRPLNRAHVSRLVRSGGQWPPIEVVHVAWQGEERYGVIDGRHRWEAAKKLELEYIAANVREYVNDEEI